MQGLLSRLLTRTHRLDGPEWYGNQTPVGLMSEANMACAFINMGFLFGITEKKTRETSQYMLSISIWLCWDGATGGFHEGRFGLGQRVGGESFRGSWVLSCLVMVWDVKVSKTGEKAGCRVMFARVTGC
jgi:hypothetical protein